MLSIVLAQTACHSSRRSMDFISQQKGEEKHTGTLVLPLAIEKSQLLQWLWGLVPDTLFEMRPTVEMPARIRIQKDTGLEASWRGEALWIAIPLKVHLFRKMGLLTTKGEATLRLHVHCAVRFDSDWNVHTSTSLDYIEWIEKPKFSILGLQFSPVGIIEQYLYDRMPHWLKELDNTLKEENPLPIYVRSIAKMLYRGVTLSESLPGYLHLSIRDVRLSHIRERNDKLYADILLRCGPLIWSEERHFDSASVPVLSYGVHEPKGGVVQWNQPIRLTEAVVSELADSVLSSRAERDKTVRLLGATYRIERIRVRFREGKIRLLAMLVGVHNRDTARLNYSFRPMWEQEEKLWSFRSPELQFHTTNRFLKLVWWLSKRWFRRVWNAYIESRWNAYWRETLRSAMDWEMGDTLRLQLPISVRSIRVDRVDDGVLALRVRVQGSGSLQSEHWLLQMGRADQ